MWVFFFKETKNAKIVTTGVGFEISKAHAKPRINLSLSAYGFECSAQLLLQCLPACHHHMVLTMMIMG